METLGKRSTYNPIQPTIIDEDMIPNVTEMSRLAAKATTSDDTDADDCGKPINKKRRWPNRVIYMIVAVVVVCFIIIAAYYWWKTNDEEIRSTANTKKQKTQQPQHQPQPHTHAHQHQPPGMYPNEGMYPSTEHRRPPQTPEEWDSYSQTVDDNRLRQYIKKPKPSSDGNAQHKQRHVIVEDVTLEVVPEEPVSDTHDGNDDETRAQFTKLLQKGIKKEKSSSHDTVLDVDDDITDDAYAMVDPVECDFILTSGKNKGSPCAKQCSDDATRCSRHINK